MVGKNLDQDVTTSQMHMPIVFQHVATQVVVDFNIPHCNKLDSLDSVSTLLPCLTFSIQTGIIELI